MFEVVAEPRPRYVVELGSEERFEYVNGQPAESRIVWSFHRAYTELGIAKEAARRAATENAYVRVVDRGEA